MSSKAHLVAKKKREMRENIEEAANELLAHFNHRNQDALMKVTKNTLESLRKLITSSSMVHYLGKDNAYIGRTFPHNLIHFIENKVILNGG